MAVDARALSNIILQEAERLGIDVYATTLLKVLYFAHGWHLAISGEPLVAQPFEAWQFGPVVRVVYDQIKNSNRRPIDIRLSAFSAAALQSVEAQCELKHASFDLLISVLRAYSHLHPYTLSDMTHEADSPWSKVWLRSTQGLTPGARIENSEIRKYFLRQNAADVLGRG